MFIPGPILLCGVVLPGLATAYLQSPHVPALDNRSPRIDTNIPLVSINKNLPLRILPLGDSLTWGYLSSDGNGYRLDLLNLLSQNQVEYIGSQRSGNMTENHNEGHPGAMITQMGEYVTTSIHEPPNVVLLMAGTLDIVNDVELDSASERLGHLIDEVVKAFPRAAVLVAQLPPIGNADSDARAVMFNAAIPSIVKRRVEEGWRIQTVNMSKYITLDDLQDGVHPTDRGYAQIARAWYDGIRAAESRMWLAPPVSKRRRINRKRDVSTPCSRVLTFTTTISPSDSTTTLTSTTTITSTMTATYRAVIHTSKITTTVPVPISTTTPCTHATNSTSVPFFAPTNTPVPFPINTTSIITAVVTIPKFSRPASLSIPSSSAAPTSSSSDTPPPPLTSNASRLAGNLPWMIGGLVFFWLSGMAI